METLASNAPLLRTRRTFTREFKAMVVEACKEPGNSVAGVTQTHQLNANLVHRWCRQLDKQETQQFIPLPPAENTLEEPRTVRIELPNGGVVHWPEDRILESSLWIKTLRP